MPSSQDRYWKDPEFRKKRLAIGRAYHHAHKEAMGARKSLRGRTDPDYRAACCASSRKRQRKSHLKYEHGLTLTEYDALLARQNGVCAICKQASDRPLFVDHCHVTGTIRALLCYRCNSAIGFCWDDPAITGALAAYLEAARSKRFRPAPWHGFSMCRSRSVTVEFVGTPVRRRRSAPDAPRRPGGIAGASV